MTRPSRSLVTAFCAALAIPLSWLLARDGLQWALCLLALSVMLVSLCVYSRREVLKLAGLTLSVLSLGFFAIEAYYALSEYSPGSGVASGPSGTAVIPVELARSLGTSPELRPFYEHERSLPDFGSYPKPQAGRYFFGIMSEPTHQPVFTVIYSTLPSGWRVTPQNPGARKAALFFGCSYTFGWGLPDEETLPYKVGELLGEEYQTFNFGINGSGAHQFLAMLENGLIDDIAGRYEEISVFFLTFSSHPERGFARAITPPSSKGWPSGPWYELQGDGSLLRRGVFPATNFNDTWLYRQLNKSYLFQKMVRIYEKMGKPAERALYFALLEKADALLQERYKTLLTVISWPGVKFTEELKNRRIDVLDLSALFPDYRRDRLKYCVHPQDLHPNALATGIAARAVTERLREKRESMPGR